MQVLIVITETNQTALYVEKYFSQILKEVCKKFFESVDKKKEFTSDDEYDHFLNEFVSMPESPAELADIFSWSFFSKNLMAGGATGRCEIYLKDPDSLAEGGKVETRITRKDYILAFYVETIL